MRKLHLLLTGIALVALISSFSVPSSVEGKMGSLTVSWSFKGIVTGYDHDNKCKVWVDGAEAGESTVTKESKPNSMKVPVSKGNHRIKIVNYALYNGEWQAHTVENDYSIDCLWEGDITIKKKASVTLEFDLNGTTGAVVK